jgi:hypothetical protein
MCGYDLFFGVYTMLKSTVADILQNLLSPIFTVEMSRVRLQSCVVWVAGHSDPQEGLEGAG